VYEVQNGDQSSPGLSASEALLKIQELIALGHDPYVYDPFGDPMGLRELEQVAAMPKGSNGQQRPADAIGFAVMIG